MNTIAEPFLKREQSDPASQQASVQTVTICCHILCAILSHFVIMKPLFHVVGLGSLLAAPNAPNFCVYSIDGAVCDELGRIFLISNIAAVCSLAAQADCKHSQ
jgi:hypothetical protein